MTVVINSNFANSIWKYIKYFINFEENSAYIILGHHELLGTFCKKTKTCYMQATLINRLKKIDSNQLGFSSYR